MMVFAPVGIGVALLTQYYQQERKAGRAATMFRHREREGRWGAALILMGSSLFFALGSESGWFVTRECVGLLTGLAGIILIAGIAEGLAWWLGRDPFRSN